ncbi:MAG: PAS domain S-box protein [Chloroflexi bacterium]|nr:MAG: PAS domain S-box protein [Chloroflexota bacterium]
MPGSGPQSASRARVLVRRATPFAALAAVFAVQALASAGPVVAFPLYLAVVLLVSLQQDRAESVTVAVVAAIAVLIRPLAAAGQASEVAPAVLLAAVLVAVAIAMNELTRHSREAAAAAQHKVDEIAASEQRLRATLESAQVGLALAHLDGRWVEVNEPLAAMLGRSCDEVVHGSLGEIVIADDQAALEEGLALLRAGDVTRWDAAIHLARADGAEVAAAAFIARIPNAAAGGASLLVQLADISARSRADQLRDCAGAVRQIIVTAVGLEGALPQLLGAFCDQLDWDVAQYWSPDADGQSMRARPACEPRPGGQKRRGSHRPCMAVGRGRRGGGHRAQRGLRPDGRRPLCRAALGGRVCRDRRRRGDRGHRAGVGKGPKPPGRRGDDAGDGRGGDRSVHPPH